VTYNKKTEEGVQGKNMKDLRGKRRYAQKSEIKLIEEKNKNKQMFVLIHPL
jgi:hypothetical protein